MQHMNYETFIHHVALDLKKYLPKEYTDYEVVVKCENSTDKKAKLTLERNHATFYRQIALEPYYKKYENGLSWQLMMREIVVDLTNTNINKKEKHTPPNRTVLILVIGGVVLFISGYYLTFRNRI